MKNRRNYYRLLQVQPDAPTEVIRTSYRTLMKELKQHPDLGGSSSAAALLNEAHRVLCDPTLRAGYDRELFVRYNKRTLSAAASGEGPAPSAFCRFCNAPLDDKGRSGRWCMTCRIPLQTPKTADFERLARRAVGRTTRRERIFFCTQWPQEPQGATMINFSPKGLRFLSRVRLAPGAMLKISGPDFEASAVVRNVRDEVVDGADLHAIGVAFIAVDFDRPRGSFLSTSA
jgi:DnaJ domain